MSFTRLPYRGEADLPKLSALVAAQPLACRHCIDLPWRISAPDIQASDDAALWQDAAGRVVGFAAWQTPWATLDFFLMPDLPADAAHTLATDLFAWANARFRQRDAERGRPLPYSVEFRDDDAERRNLVLAHGFTLDEQAHYVTFEHDLRDLSGQEEQSTLPEGFALRPLGGASEAATCAELQRAAFASEAMTVEWRARVLRTPQYRPDLDLVIAAPDGALAAFCLGWYDAARRIGQVEPMGVHPRFQGLGLSHTLLLALLRSFRTLGAERALVETNLDRAAARGAYGAVGFREAHTVWRLETWAPSQAEAEREAEMIAAHVGPLTLHNGQIDLAEPDPTWPQQYAAEERKIRAALGERALLVEHVGSTSVPGLPAKPLLDILLVVADPADEAAYVPALEAQGYRLHIREPNWHEHRLLKGASPDVNLHVFGQGDAEPERMLRFRDWLRAHDDDRDLYAQTKRDLARRTWKYTQNYADAKSAVVEGILTRAATETQE